MKKTILLNAQFYWTNDFTKRSFREKKNEKNVNWTIILENQRYNFLTVEKKNERTAWNKAERVDL